MRLETTTRQIEHFLYKGRKPDRLATSKGEHEMTNSNRTLCLVVRWPFIAVREDCNSTRNIGAIEKKHRGGGYPGTLNFKRILRGLTGTPLAALTLANPPGQLRRGAGTGFEGWIDYGTIRKAIEFLISNANLVFCPIAGVVVCKDGRLIPIPLPTGHGRNEWTALQDAIERAIRRGLAPKQIVFREGTGPIPLDFETWCAEHGIEILVADAFDNQYPLPDLAADFDDLPPWMDEEGNPFFQ